MEQVVDVLLARFDGDDDGAIALPELLAVLDPKGHRQKIAEALSVLTDAVDVDTDGNDTMSQDELNAAVAMLDTDGNDTLDHHDHVPGPPADETEVDLIGILLPQLRQFDVGVLDPPF